MDVSRNIVRIFDEGPTQNKLSAIELSVQKLTNRIFELELLETIALETVEKCRVKEKEVAEEIRKLEELQYERWESRNEFCEKVWKFSGEHDLCALFNQYLDMPKKIPRERVVFDKNRHPDVQNRRMELEDLKNQLLSKSAVNKSLEKKVMQAKIQLQIAKSYREKDSEIIRLKTDIDNYQAKYFDLESKIAMMEMQFVDWQQLLATPAAETKRNFVTATELIAQDEMKDTIKRSRFSVKRESAISRKLTDTRGSARRS